MTRKKNSKALFYLRAGVAADEDERASDVEAPVAIGHTCAHFAALRFCKRRDPLRRDGVEAREGSGDCPPVRRSFRRYRSRRRAARSH